MASLFRSLRVASRVHASPISPLVSPSSFRLAIAPPCSLLQSSRTPTTTPSLTSLFSTSTTLSTWGGGKLKTHQGTKKRFKPISKRRKRASPSPITMLFGHLPPGQSKTEAINAFVAQRSLSPANNQPVKQVNLGARPGPLFKRAKTGKRHLNVRKSGSKMNSLGGTTVTGTGRLGWHLRKLMPYA